MTAGLREAQAAAVHASWMDILGRNARRSAIPALAVGAFLGFVGAFGSSDMPLVGRIPFMIAISLVGAALGQTSYHAAERNPWVAARWWRVGLVSAGTMFAPMGLFVWAAVSLVDEPKDRFNLALLPGFLGVSLVTSAFFCMTVAWLHSLAPRRDEPAGAAAPVKFLARLPLKLRGAEIWAVEAEDHYLRLHTSKGQDLILMRLADAIAELDGVEGMQVHRSWWVSRDAIADAKRGDGRAVLTLRDGSTVPVSRTYAGHLRDRNWI